MIVSRIRKGYEARFRDLLKRVGARRLDQGVAWLVDEARKEAGDDGPALNKALEQVYERLVVKRPFRPINPRTAVRFYCDAGLGGLARWLRGAGHEAFWQPDIPDGELLRQARALSASVLTTDSGLMERRLVRDGIIRAFWLPPTLKIPQQLVLVFREFKLAAGEPRCMNCGGELKHVDKESLKERIPPKTYRWLDEFFLCTRCDKLLWRGTHWERISSALRKL
jgi:uncharacterized protein